MVALVARDDWRKLEVAEGSFGCWKRLRMTEAPREAKVESLKRDSGRPEKIERAPGGT